MQQLQVYDQIFIDMVRIGKTYIERNYRVMNLFLLIARSAQLEFNGKRYGCFTKYYAKKQLRQFGTLFVLVANIYLDTFCAWFWTLILAIVIYWF